MLGPDINPNILMILKTANVIRGRLIAQNKIVTEPAVSSDGQKVFLEYSEPSNKRQNIIVDNVTVESFKKKKENNS